LFFAFIAAAVFILFIALLSCTYTVDPGTRGIVVTLGHADQDVKTPGFGFKIPFVSDVKRINVQVQSVGSDTVCFSSDLQQVTVSTTVSYHIADDEVVSFYTTYGGDLTGLLNGVIWPRAQEALKQKTALLTASDLVTNREQVKDQALTILREKTAGIATIDDLVINNVTLSPELEAAIEQKMVQQQNADKAKFAQDQARIDAETAQIVAEGQAKSIEIQGEALAKTPQLVQLKIVEKWDGKAPLYVGGNSSGANMLLPIQPAQ